MIPAITLDRAPLHVGLRLVVNNAEPTTQRRLATLGLRAGAVIEAVQRTPGGGRVVSVAGSRIALGRELLPALEVSLG